jgi:beta-phosphoglucomutase-like phosphatase (HAD superfamily)
MPIRCIIFDMDGTLVDSEAIDDHLFRAAVEEVLGRVRIREDWNDYEHITGAGLIRDICRDNSLEFDGAEERVKNRFGELVSRHLRLTGPCLPIAGAAAFWRQIRADDRFTVGVATGDWEHTARMKLNAAGYDLEGVCLASSDDSQVRTGIMEHCRSMLPPTQTTTYIGDGEWDLAATTALGWHFIGVGERLRGKCPDWIPDFLADRLLNQLSGERQKQRLPP